MIHDHKDRTIHALYYRDRVVQHCICDEGLGPAIDKKLIYDNATCRYGKRNLFVSRMYPRTKMIKLPIIVIKICTNNCTFCYTLQCYGNVLK